MPEYSDGAYDVIFDKGALDALMSEDTAEVAEKARGMFFEISRLLSDGGKYVCITLAESFILKALLSHYTTHQWAISVESVQHGKPSPFKPFYISITKLKQKLNQSQNQNQNQEMGQKQRAEKCSHVDLMVDSFGNDAVGRSITAATAAEEVSE